MVPWFIWKQIIKYAVQEDRGLCLVNKEWFKTSAGQFITIKYDELTNFDLTLKSFTLAENLELLKFNNIDWKLLSEFSRLNHASFELYNVSDNDFEQLKSFVWNSKLISIRLSFKNNTGFEQSFQLLKGISKQLRKLKICDNRWRSPYIKLLSLDYKNLTELIIYKEVGTICFDIIHKYMSNIEYISFYINIEAQPLDSEIYTFPNVKALVINMFRYKSIFPIKNPYVFNHVFPKLKEFSTEHDFGYNLVKKNLSSAPKFTQSNSGMSSIGNMANFQPISYEKHSNDFSSYSNEKQSNFFPNNDLNELEKLTFYLERNSFDLKLDLSKLPKLKILEVPANCELVNSNNCLIYSLNFNKVERYKHQSIINELNYLNEVKINCQYGLRHAYNILIFFNIVTKLTLYGLGDTISMFPRLTSFKTTHLEIRGSSFLDQHTINWLANNLPLTHLTIVYEKNWDEHNFNYNLTPVLFSKLKYLYIECEEEIDIEDNNQNDKDIYNSEDEDYYNNKEEDYRDEREYKFPKQYEAFLRTIFLYNLP